MISEGITLAVTTVGSLVLSFFVSDIVEAATNKQPNEWLDFIYEMTSLMVPVFVALVWTRRKKRKEKDDKTPE